MNRELHAIIAEALERAGNELHGIDDVHAFLKHLREHKVTIVQGHDFNDLLVNKVAKQLKVSPATVKIRMKELGEIGLYLTGPGVEATYSGRTVLITHAIAAVLHPPSLTVADGVMLEQELIDRGVLEPAPEATKEKRGKEKTTPPIHYKWGFDIVDFGSSDTWQSLCRDLHLQYHGPTNSLAFLWKRQDGQLHLTTQNNPLTGEYGPGNRPTQPGFASYIGIEGRSDFVLLAVEAVRQYATSIKGESPHKRSFI